MLSFGEKKSPLGKRRCKKDKFFKLKAAAAQKAGAAARSLSLASVGGLSQTLTLSTSQKNSQGYNGLCVWGRGGCSVLLFKKKKTRSEQKLNFKTN